MSDSPWLTFFLILVIGEIIIRIVVGLPRLILRHLNILNHGWPPVHCDADGDFKEEN